jgi:hypothetical protein
MLDFRAAISAYGRIGLDVLGASVALDHASTLGDNVGVRFPCSNDDEADERREQERDNEADNTRPTFVRGIGCDTEAQRKPEQNQ